MEVIVHAPLIHGETVHYSWQQSDTNPFQHENAFFIRYETISLSRFSVDLFHEIFLALQLRVFAAYRVPITITFAHPIPAPTIAFWTAYHNADLVTVSPVDDVQTYSPWAVGIHPTGNQHRYGVFFGGGKDSLSISCLLTELKEAANVVLFQFVHPFTRGEATMREHTTRQNELMLKPIRDVLGVTSQRAWTNYLSRFKPGFSGKPIRPHLELYSVGFLPALLHWGIEVCMPGLGRNAFRLNHCRDGTTTYRYPQSRPEMLRAQTRYLQRVLGVDLSVSNLNLMLSPLMAFRLLAERYPAALQEVVMCVAAPSDQRWCYHCVKCIEYVLFSLRCGLIDERFDYDFFFTESRYVQRWVAYAESGVELTQHGNAPWQPFITIAGAHGVFCHAIAQIEPALLRGRIGPIAMANLLTIKALFGNTSFPNMEMIATDSVEAIGTDLARAVAAIMAEHFPVVSELPQPIVVGTGEAIFDYGHRMQLRSGLE